VPYLIINIMPLELASGCGGVIKAELSAHLDRQTNSMEAEHTHVRVRSETVNVWSSTHTITGPKRTFAEQATGVAEELIKELVNDWTASQELPEYSHPVWRCAN
jgi:hypothetical protein